MSCNPSPCTNEQPFMPLVFRSHLRGGKKKKEKQVCRPKRIRILCRCNPAINYETRSKESKHKYKVSVRHFIKHIEEKPGYRTCLYYRKCCMCAVGHSEHTTVHLTTVILSAHYCVSSMYKTSYSDILSPKIKQFLAP